MDPEMVSAAANILAVNAVATLLLAVMSYLLAKFALDGLESIDRRLDPSHHARKGNGEGVGPSSLLNYKPRQPDL